MKHFHEKTLAGILALSILFSVASCGRKESEEQTEPSRSLQTSSISPITEGSSDDPSDGGSGDIGNGSADPDPGFSEETTEPTWGGAPWNKPSSFDFNLKYSDDLKVVDYGKSTVNVYHGRYNVGEEPIKWEERSASAWIYNDTNYLMQWGHGEAVMDPRDSFKWSVPDREKSLSNIHSVEAVPLSMMPDGKEVANNLNLPSDTQVLMWTYDVADFPWDYFEDADWIEIPRDIKTTKVVQLDSQYVDGLPLTGGRTYCDGYDTFEWEGVVGPSRLRSDVTGYFYQGIYHKPDGTCTYIFPTNTYTITDTILENQTIVDPTTCLDAIRKTLLYSPSFGGSFPDDDRPPFPIHIWEMDIEVYLMELSYVVLDPEPLEYDDPDLASHELTLVPVWEVYVTVTDPENEQLLQTRKLMINAVTGASLYSDKYGPNENEVLYPHLHDPG
ncbi:MAG: hypothetical protein IK109_03510 [Clostridiales bacterium]|nr:hypothetical protein [Clostridiales bacterium]